MAAGVAAREGDEESERVRSGDGEVDHRRRARRSAGARRRAGCCAPRRPAGGSRSGQLARVVGAHRRDRREPVGTVRPPSGEIDDDVGAARWRTTQTRRCVPTALTTRFGVGTPGRVLRFDVGGRPSSQANTVRNPRCGAIAVTESATACASGGTGESVRSITIVQPAPIGSATPPVPSRVSISRIGCDRRVARQRGMVDGVPVVGVQSTVAPSAADVRCAERRSRRSCSTSVSAGDGRADRARCSSHSGHRRRAGP